MPHCINVSSFVGCGASFNSTDIGYYSLGVKAIAFETFERLWTLLCRSLGHSLKETIILSRCSSKTTELVFVLGYLGRTAAVVQSPLFS